MTNSITARHEAAVAAGRVERDAAQLAVVERLARLETGSRSIAWRANPPRSAGCSAVARVKAPIRGLYIHGDVGRGKTMLMDLFFEVSRCCASVARISTNSCSTCTSACTPCARR